MANQKLFDTLKRVCDFTALETDMAEIIDAVEKDNPAQLNGRDLPSAREMLRAKQKKDNKTFRGGRNNAIIFEAMVEFAEEYHRSKAQAKSYSEEEKPDNHNWMFIAANYLPQEETRYRVLDKFGVIGICLWGNSGAPNENTYFFDETNGVRAKDIVCWQSLPTNTERDERPMCTVCDSRVSDKDFTYDDEGLIKHRGC